MPRRFGRSRRAYYTRSVKAVKYSNETTTGFLNWGSGSTTSSSISLITALNQQGMRKAKNFTLRLATNSNDYFLWALVYVPQGTTASSLSVAGSSGNPGVSIYEPNQNVIISGYIYGGAPQETFKSRLARNLNSGDSIQLVIRPVSATTGAANVNAALNFAITY